MADFINNNYNSNDNNNLIFILHKIHVIIIYMIKCALTTNDCVGEFFCLPINLCVLVFLLRQIITLKNRASNISQKCYFMQRKGVNSADVA